MKFKVGISSDVLVAESNILYVKSHGAFSRLYLKDSSIIDLKETLRDIEIKLNNRTKKMSNAESDFRSSGQVVLVSDL